MVLPGTHGLERLAQAVEGEVGLDPVTRSIYATGACLYRVEPRAVVWPRGLGDVISILEFASRLRLPVTARGGGTSRTGNELGEGIVVDFSRHMNRILDLDPEARLVRVEPGVVLADLNEFLKPHGLFFPPDPSTKDHCTIGGMIANNSSGPMSVKYGTTRKHVESLEMVLTNGDVIRTGPLRLDQTAGSMGAREGEIYGVVAEALKRYSQALVEERPFATKDSSGYHLWEVHREDGSLDLTPLIVGSEGTLGIVTQATLRLMPILPARLSAMVYFQDISTVGEATQRILEFGPSMVEIMERQILELARESNPALREHIPESTEAILVVELEGQEEGPLRDAFASIQDELVGSQGLARELRVARNAQDMALFARIRSISGPILNRIKAARRPRAFIEDPAVHPSRLPQYIEGLRRLFQEHGVEASIYGHAGDGNLHSMVFLDLSHPEDVQRMAALSSQVYDLVLELKGTISGEHGDGRLRTQFLPRQYPRLQRAFREIKEAFDPENILNPGVIVGNEEHLLERHLRFHPLRPAGTRGSMDDPSIIQEIQGCSGCGKCRSYCPVAKTMRNEWAAARAKVSLVREILSGNLPGSIICSDGFREVMGLCINCKRCLRECPSGVDVPWLALLGRGEAVARLGESLSGRLLTDTRLLCALGSATAPLSNMALETQPTRILLEKALGVDRDRRLPSFSRRTARALSRGRLRKTDAVGRVALFLSCHANFNDPKGEGIAAIEVLERNGLEVLLPDVRCCAMARINAGAGPKVLGDARHNVRALAPLAREGIPILFTEPSCLLALKMEYPRLLDSEEGIEVARECLDIHDFLLGLHSRGELNTAMSPIDARVGYHSPCHLTALGDGQGPAKLLGMIPGLRVIEYADACCGMGGTFGLKARYSVLSREMGHRLAEQISHSGVDLVATSCGACKMQLQQATGLKVVHPLSLLARAYAAKKNPKPSSSSCGLPKTKG